MIKKRKNPKFSDKLKNDLAQSAIYLADSGFGRNEHPIRSAEKSATYAVDYYFKNIKHTKQDLKDAHDLWMDVFMYAYFGILKNDNIKKLYIKNRK